MKQWFDTLGLPIHATQEQVKSAYRRLAKEYHPDLGGDEEKFKAVAAAYSNINDVMEMNKHSSSDDIINGFFWDHIRQASKPRRQRYNPAEEGRNPVHLIITVDEIRKGKTFTHNITRSAPCTKCPEYSIDKECMTCQGFGFTNTIHPLTFMVQVI